MTKPIFERRHFDLIASIVRELKTGDRLCCAPYTPLASAVHEQVAREFCARLNHTNPNFSRARFLEACGVKDG